ncbi:serine/threonine-protein kinase [Streptomyces sp. NP160]|uniref:serine/threonine-protein kinase n=1 Tax=Streptomyces sp. NP160 TaxID=2586637 RepID=UPI001C5630BD|nr:serine/threonine-protein kinase [Streptomyces sp. NP160]
MDARTSGPVARDGAGSRAPGWPAVQAAGAARPAGAPAAAPAAPATPSVIGRLGPYRLLQVIGGGGMGVVHLGLDPAGRAVAIKVLRPHVAADPSARSRLAREVDALQRVRSPRVAEVLDADPDADQPYVVTEFVPAPPLDVLVEREGPLAGAALGRLGLGLGDALAAIHHAGVVHRDLKPGNVLVADGDPVVIDFGIAQVADDVRLTSAGLVMGTPGYLAPEVLDGASPTSSGDWWGWAATLAFAATGRPPFGTGPSEAVLSRVRRGAADLTGVPGALLGLLGSALSPDPALRPPPRRLRQAVQALLEPDAGTWPPVRTGSSAAPTAAVPVHRPAPAPAAPVSAVLPETSVMPEAAPPLVGAPPEAAPVPWPEPPVRGPGADTPTEVVDASTAPSARGSHPAPPAAGTTRVLPSDPSPPRLPAGSLDRTQVVLPPAPARSAPEQPDRDERPGQPQQHDGAHRGPPPPYDPPRGYERPEPPAGQSSPYAPIGDAAEPGRPVTGAVLLLLLLVAVALGAVAPLVAAIAVAGAVVVARTVDRSVAAVVRRRYERGPRRSDGAVVALALPGQLLLALLASLPALLLPAAMAVSTAFLVGWAIAPQSTPVPGQALPLAAAVLVGTATAWWGPGSRTVRRGTRTAVRGALPGRTSSLVAVSVLALVLLACAIVVANSGGTPDWTPLTTPPPGLG